MFAHLRLCSSYLQFVKEFVIFFILRYFNPAMMDYDELVLLGQYDPDLIIFIHLGIARLPKIKSKNKIYFYEPLTRFIFDKSISKQTYRCSNL